MTVLNGEWLLQHSTASWRIADREKGFQRVVKEARAKAIAVAVLDQGRTFPNAIVLATNKPDFAFTNGRLGFPRTSKFLVVDGQHRLWAQKYSSFPATYACLIHMGLTEVDMAKLFLEINDTQKRVPSSLRWDLVRLVRPEDDPFAIKATELVLALTESQESPLFQRIDLTGENGNLTLKQGSIAPELKTIFSSRGLRDTPFDDASALLVRYLAALRSLDADGWRAGTSSLLQSRVMRVLLRLLPRLLQELQKPADKCRESDFRPLVLRISLDSLEQENIKAAQGSAGMKEIYNQVLSQLFPTTK